MRKINPIFIYLFLFLLVSIIRFPYFFDSVIDWDESTYIIMGQDLLDGNLPYINLWENKPPLAFLFYALFILLFGKSIVAVRLGGLLCVFISACIIYKIGKRIYGNVAGFFAACLLIIFSSTFPGGQATMTEHLTLVPTSLILLFLLAKNYTNRITFIIGLLLSLTALIRINMVYLVPIAGLIIFLDGLKNGIFYAIRKSLILISGIFLPGLVIGCIYLANNALDLLIKSMFTAPLALIPHNAQSLLEKSPSTVKMIIDSCIISENFFAPLLFLGGIIILYIRPGVYGRREKTSTTIILILFLSVLFSIIYTGTMFAHYLIQLIPFVAVIGGACLSYFFISWPKKFLYLFLVIGLFPVLKPAAGKNAVILKKIYNKESLFSDTGYRIVNYLNRYDLEGEYVYFCDLHIGYWLTNTKIPTKYVHPSSVGKEYFIKAVDGEAATAESTLQMILLKKPLFIIKTDKLRYFNNQCNAVLDDEIENNYELEKQVKNMHIYKKRNAQKGTVNESSSDNPHL